MLLGKRKGGVQMEETKLFTELDFARSFTLKALSIAPSSMLDEMPGGAVNNLRWHFGHIYTAQCLLINSFTDFETDLQSHYKTYFGPKTSPSDWKGQPPSKEEMFKLLADQPAKVKSLLSGKAHLPAKKPFKTGTHGDLTSIEDILRFAVFHEGQHIGAIKMLLRVLGVNVRV
jgi:uncharacterized damage-inducible protein DinB